MKFGTILRLPSPAVAKEAFLKLKESGYDCCHLVFKPEEYKKEDAQIIKKAAEECEIEIFALFAGFRDTAIKWDLYEDFKTAGIDNAIYGKERMAYVKQAALFCKEMGVKKILIHGGFVANNPFSQEYISMCESVKELALFLKDNGLELLLETGGESPITLLRLIEDTEMDNVFVNLDTSNIIMYGFGSPAEAVYTLNKYIKSIHIKDGLPPTSPKKLGAETEFGEGFVDFEKVIALLKKIDYNGPFIIEREINDDKGDQKRKETLEKLKGMI